MAVARILCFLCRRSRGRHICDGDAYHALSLIVSIRAKCCEHSQILHITRYARLACTAAERFTLTSCDPPADALRLCYPASATSRRGTPLLLCNQTAAQKLMSGGLLACSWPTLRAAFMHAAANLHARLIAAQESASAVPAAAADAYVVSCARASLGQMLCWRQNAANVAKS